MEDFKPNPFWVTHVHFIQPSTLSQHTRRADAGNYAQPRVGLQRSKGDESTLF